MDAYIPVESLRAALLTLPEMAEWPEVADVFAARGDRVRLDWQLPVLGCRAAGGDASALAPAAAAVACLQISIILVDDILDSDPRGKHREIGSGRAANLALAFQAASLSLVEQACADPARKAAAALCIARAASATAFGQELDVQNLQGETNYWRVVRTKSTPFYGAGLQLGGILAGATPSVVQGLYDVGVGMGTLIQMLDDLDDAFATPANPDWFEGRNNLAILYAKTADHPLREHFAQILPLVHDPASLREAQAILISSGAVSYIVYLIIKRYQATRSIIEPLALPNGEIIHELIEQQVTPLTRWLQNRGLPVPPQLPGWSQ